MNREERLARAADELRQQTQREDAAAIATSLDQGLTILCGSLYDRLHVDVERVLGTDSMFVPISEVKTEQKTKIEIDIFQAAVSAAAVDGRSYCAPSDWYASWLLRLRLGSAATEADIVRRAEQYAKESPDERRLLFSNVLTRALPETRKAPLIIFRLMPLAVEIVTAQAFGDRAGADALRQEQRALLPAVNDCETCHGEVLPCGGQCATCGNPLWNFEYLTITD